MRHRNIIRRCLFVAEKTAGKLYPGAFMTLFAGLSQIIHASHRRIGVKSALDIMNAVTVGAGCLVQLSYFVGAQLDSFTVKATHIGLIDLFHNAIVCHQCFIIMAFSASLSDVLLISRGIIFQHPDDAVRVPYRAMTIDTGRYIRVATDQLLAVNTCQMLFIFILVAATAFLQDTSKKGLLNLKKRNIIFMI